MKHLITLVFFFLSFQSIFSQTYSYCFITYIGDDTRYMSVCAIEPFSPLKEKQIDGYDRPEANFRSWLKNSFSEVSGIAYYFAVTKEEAIGYYKSNQPAYQSFGREYKKSTYCPTIFWIPYVEKVKNETKSTNSTNSSNNSSITAPSYGTSSPTNSTTTETASQRQYREQQERSAETQRQNEAASKQFVSDATELVGMLGNMFASNSAAREKKLERKEAERKEKEAQKIKSEENRKIYLAHRQEKLIELNNSLAYYLPQAKRGNDDAVTKLIDIYDKKIEFNVENTLNTKIKVLEDLYNDNKSVVATSFLKKHYTEMYSSHKKIYKYHISRSIQNLLVGGALSSIRVFVPKKFDPSGGRDTDNFMYREVFGFAFAGYFGITGLVHTFRIGKSKSKFVEANNKLKKINSNSPRISLSPSFNFQRGDMGFAMRITL
jgi:hypothetical protein